MNRTKRIVLFVAAAIGVVLIIVALQNALSTAAPSYSKILSYFEQDLDSLNSGTYAAKRVIKSQDLDFGTYELTLEFTTPQEINGRQLNTLTYKIPSLDLFLSDTADYRAAVLSYNRTVGTDDQVDISFRAAENNYFLSLLPWLILLVGMFVFYYLMMRQQSGGTKIANFGKARYKTARDDKRKVTFDDVAGVDEEKEELTEVVEFLKNPGQFTALGARVPKGVLLVGPPGTGKTLLARAVAGEAGVQFFSVSGSDFVEMYVGMGASRVRDLFEQAKKNLPCIIFIDEIDAVGRRRGAGLGGGHDEREQTLNQILVEMDGFGANEGVVIMAATNRPDVLDPALLRAGRFDRQIVVSMPDAAGREAVLRVHAKKKPLAPDVDLAVIAKTTVGFSPADLENILNEAALLAARRKRKAITNADIEDAENKVMMGPEKRSRKVTEKDRRLTAYHEAGHAIVSYNLPTQDPVHEISIVPRGMAGGYTMYRPEEDKSYATRNELMEEITSMLGGRASEALVLDDISTGASNDIQRATQTARSMVTKYGFSDELGTVCFDSGEEVFLGRDFSHMKSISETFCAKIDEEVEKLIKTGYQRAQQILSDNLPTLHKVAAVLLEKEKLSGADFITLMKTGELPSAPAAPAAAPAPQPEG